MSENLCRGCKFFDVDISDEPCNTCVEVNVLGFPEKRTRSNWQPDRPKRKELGDQLSAANAEINRLKVELSVCQQRHKIRDGILTTANAELESMHRELAAKDAEIAEWKRIHAILKKEQLALYKNRTRIIKDLNAKQAIIDEQEKVVAAQANEIDFISTVRQSQSEMIARLRLERDEARRWAIKLRDEVAKFTEWGKKDKAIIADLERELEAAKRTHTYTYILPMQKLRMIPTTAGKWKK